MINLGLAELLELVIPLLLIEGLYSGSEIALLSVDKVTLQQKFLKASGLRKIGLELAIRLTEQLEKILATTLLVTSLCVISISALISVFLYQHAPGNSEILAILIASPTVVLFGEFLPKAIYQRFALQLAGFISFPIYFGFYFFFPITKFLSIYTSRLSKWISPIETIVTGKRRTTRDELKNLISYGKAESEIRLSEKKMITRILDFKDSDAATALIPLVSVDAIPSNATTSDALQEFRNHRHSRMPIYEERVDNILGVLEVNDLITETNLDTPVTQYMTPGHFVPEHQALNDVLIEMKENRSEMTIVVDEHGGAVGILTFEDIAEEIVGELYDEHDSEELPYKTLEDGRWLVSARTEIEILNENLRLALPDGDYETLSGFLLQQFGRIPHQKDELYFDTVSGSYRFSIHTANEKTILQVEIERLENDKPLAD